MAIEHYRRHPPVRADLLESDDSRGAGAVDSAAQIDGLNSIGSIEAGDDHCDSGTRFRLPDAELERMFDEACNVALPERIGRYRILNLLGAGGMGVVYRAEQDHPCRLVALKTLRLGMADRRMTARFENEIASLAHLRHPNIAQIYDAGVATAAWGGQPYISMELIEGPRLTEFVRQRRLCTADRLRLFAKVCDAVEHAHQRGVIHRDLKPANILVAAGDERGNEGLKDSGSKKKPHDSASIPQSLNPLFPASAQPKILDFGVARLLHHDNSRTLATTAGEILGTLAYMSPEQVSGSPDAVDTRTDVYALGCVLYELLAGRPPIELGDLPVARASERIRSVWPQPLREHDPSLRGDLEIIVAKALEKDPEQRYARAASLADDIRRCLAGQPIAARRPSAAYVVRKWVGRHRVACALSALVLLSMFVGASGLIAGMLRAHRESESKQQLIQAAIEGLSGIASDVLPGLTPIAGTLETRRGLLTKLVPLRDVLMGSQGDDPKLLAAQADVLNAISYLDDERSDGDTRLQNRTAVLAARRRLATVAPHDQRQALRFAIDHVRIGDIFKERRNFQTAEDWYARAFEIQRAQAKADPGCIDAGIALTWSHARLADTARQLGRPTHMRELLEAAESLLSRLVAVTAGSEEIRLLDVRQQCLALWTDYFSMHGLDEETYRAQLGRVDCLRQLHALEPANLTHALRTAAAALDVAGNEAGTRDDCGAARDHLEFAQPLIEKLARLEPRNAEVLELRVYAAHSLARIEAREGRPATGLRVALCVRSLLWTQLTWAPQGLSDTLLHDNSELIDEFAQFCGQAELGKSKGRESDEWRDELARCVATQVLTTGSQR